MRLGKKVLTISIVTVLLVTLSISINEQVLVSANDENDLTDNIFDANVLRPEQLNFSTFFGGSDDEQYSDMADTGKCDITLDSEDNIIIVGRTESTNLPTVNAFQDTYNGGSHDAFVAKLSPDGQTVLFCTYLGGNGAEWASCVTTDIYDNIIVGGTTSSINFPTLNYYQETNLGGPYYGTDAFIAQKLLREVYFMKISGIYRKGLPLLLFLFVLICLLFLLHAIGSSAESGGGGVTVIPDGSILIQIANFVFTIWVLNLLLYKPIRKILTQRKGKVDGLELLIETATKDALEKDEAFIAGVKEARSRGVEKKNTLMQTAADEEKSIIADINRKAQAELLQVREKIKKEVEVAKDSLQKEVDSFADQISEKILGRAA